jgi:hypothetical protein
MVEMRDLGIVETFHEASFGKAHAIRSARCTGGDNVGSATCEERCPYPTLEFCRFVWAKIDLRIRLMPEKIAARVETESNMQAKNSSEFPIVTLPIS